MVRRIGGEERSFRAGQAVGEGGTARGVEPLTATEMAAMSEPQACDLCGETAGVRVYDDEGTALCPAHVPLVFANTARRNKALTAALADAEARAALLTAALYDEVRRPINAQGGVWTDDEIRDYLSAKWGLVVPAALEPATPTGAGEEG